MSKLQDALHDLAREQRRINQIETVLDQVFDVASQWANQDTDYDEDTEQQIADGRAILQILRCTR